jgi:chromosome segregation ATPase
MLGIERKLQEKKYDAEEKIAHIQKALGEIPKIDVKLKAFDENIHGIEARFESLKRMDGRLTETEKAFSGLANKFKTFEAPESIKKWFDAKLHGMNKELDSEISSLHEQGVRNNDEISLLRGNFDEKTEVLEKSIDELKTRHSGLDDKIEEERNYFDEGFGKLKDTITKSQEQARSLESDIDELGGRIDELKAKHSGLDDGTTKLKEQLNKSEERAKRFEMEFNAVDKKMEELKVGHSGLEDKLEISRGYFENSISKLRDLVTKSQDQIRSRLESIVYEESAKTMAKLKKEIENRPMNESEEIKFILRDLRSVKSEAGEQIRKMSEHSAGMANVEKSINAKIETYMDKAVGRSVESAKSRLLQDLKVEMRKEVVGRDEVDSLIRSLEDARTESENEALKMKKLGKDFDDLENRLRTRLASEKEDVIKTKIDSVKKELTAELDSRIKNTSIRDVQDMFASLKVGIEEQMKKLADQKEKLRMADGAFRLKLESASQKTIKEEIARIKPGLYDEISKNIHSLDTRIATNSNDLGLLNERLGSMDSAVARISGSTLETLSERVRELETKLSTKLSAEYRRMSKEDTGKIKTDIMSEINNKMHSIDGRLSMGSEDLNILNEKLKDMEMAITKLSKRPADMEDDMKKFKGYVISYLNSLADNYDEKFRSVKRDVDTRFQKIKTR